MLFTVQVELRIPVKVKRVESRKVVQRVMYRHLSLPTFLLDSNIQGIRGEVHAGEIAQQMVTMLLPEKEHAEISISVARREE